MSDGYLDLRYVREIDNAMRTIDDWHEMVDNGIATLCGLRLDPETSMEFNFRSELPRYQHQRGTGFPPGRTCEGCVNQREWLDLLSKGPIYDDAERHP